MSTTTARRQRRTKPVTIKEVASRAKVSVATVSRVLNRNIGVKAHLRKAVQDAIQDLDYDYTPPAVSSGAERYRIGLVVPTVVHPFHALLLKGVSSAALVRQAELILLSSEEDPEVEKQHLARALEGDIRGLIYIPFSPEIDPVAVDLIERKFPVVFLDRVLDRDDICTVSSDNEEGAYQAVTYLLHLGHREIVYIAGPPHLSTSGARFQGFARGMREHGLPVREELLLAGDTTFETAYAAMQKFLGSGRACTALFASNDLMAFGAWAAAEEVGLRIPADLSIIGYDEIPFSSYRSLTTIGQPSFEMGRNAFTLLIDLIEGRARPPQHVLLRDSLVIRRSCSKIS